MINRQDYQALALALLDAVRTSAYPIGVPSALEILQRANPLPQEMAVAVVWQMLAADQLRFNDSKKLTVGPVNMSALGQMA